MRMSCRCWYQRHCYPEWTEADGGDLDWQRQMAALNQALQAVRCIWTAPHPKCGTTTGPNLLAHVPRCLQDPSPTRASQEMWQTSALQQAIAVG